MSLKHVGKIKNTGRRCVVVFREIYDDKGNVIDEDNCLVVETDGLPDAEHQDMMRIVESEPAQSANDFFDVLTRERLGNGVAALNWLHTSGRLRKFPTNNIDMVPDANTIIGLDTLNKIVRMQKAGASEHDVEKAMQDDANLTQRQTEATTPADATAQPGDDSVLDNSTIAKNYVDQATLFEQQAADLRKQAYELDPALAPKKRKTTRKSTANKKA